MSEKSEKMPLLIRNSIKALNDEKRQDILMHLFNNGSKSFIEISNDLMIPKNKLSYHIKTLMRYGLLYNYYSRNQKCSNFI